VLQLRSTIDAGAQPLAFLSSASSVARLAEMSCNGGAFRQPSMRVSDELARVLRQGLIKSGLPVTDLHDHEFFIGGNPV
jgi:hypothetical protein